jgi:predicted nucleic acid-binding protein
LTHLLWDASALAKIYVSETGSTSAVALQSGVPASRMATTFVCYAEALSVLVRKRNRGEISPTSFRRAAIAALRNDVMDRPAFQLISVRDVDFAAGARYVLGQSLNSTDAALLSVFLRFAQMSRREGNDCVLVTSDRRFLRVADSEGLRVLNPESALPHEVAALVG